ncbi:hypothetical protein [Streptomyces noursei]|uniref:hypothetical protein n=1 Tax=Streptomyces noursei TaxID=1971 RepID=UPI00268896C1
MAGCGLTTVPAALTDAVPEGVAIRPVRGGAQEQRRLLLARFPGQPRDAVLLGAEALRSAALDTDAPP